MQKTRQWLKTTDGIVTVVLVVLLLCLTGALFYRNYNREHRPQLHRLSTPTETPKPGQLTTH